jgi:release factor glutamine methyltransferase
MRFRGVPMPDYVINGKNIRIRELEQVYPPSDDTFLMLNSIEVGKRNGAQGGPERVLEIGTGSGIISIYCAKMGASVVCTDINPWAVRLARANAVRNRVSLEAIRTDMFAGLNHRFDVVIFNPPYLPTDKEDVTGDRWLDASVNGGRDGKEFIRRFMNTVGYHFNDTGRAYILVSSFAGKVDLGRDGFESRVVCSVHLNFHDLAVHEIKRSHF